MMYQSINTQPRKSAKRLCTLVWYCIILGWGSALAQSFAVGASVDVGFFPINTQSPDLEAIPTTPTSVGVQFTAHRLLDILGIRGLVDVGLETGTVDVGGDLLLSFNLLNLRPYIGLGASTTLTESPKLSTHAVVGLELLLHRHFGIYTELDPTLQFENFPNFEAKLRAGASVYF